MTFNQFSFSKAIQPLNNYKTLILIAFAILIKQLIWMAIVPIWHFPDEQAHFAQVQNTAHFGRSGFEGNQAASSDEVAVSEIILDTYRDEMGRNKYTFHPEYNLKYTQAVDGFWEDLIRILPNDYTHDNELNEATVYPPLYYYLAAPFYNLGKDASLIERVFLARMVSVLLFVLTLIPVYLIAKMLAESELKRVLLVLMVMFQPMFSFVGAGVTSDVLFNLIYTSFLCVGVYLVQKVTIYRLLALILILILGSISKQQMAIAYLTLPLIAVFNLNSLKKIMFKNTKITLVVFLAISLALFLAIRSGEFFRITGFLNAGTYKGELNQLSLFEHIRWTLVHTYREVLPWYWGIFKWLGVTLSRTVHRIQMGLIAVSIIGNLIFFIKLFQVWQKDKNLKLKHKYIIFLYLSGALYFICLMMWDYYFRRNFGFSFGMQGRYFFPVIVTHMLFLLTGWNELIQLFITKLNLAKKLSLLFFAVLGSWWLILHNIGLYVVSNSYYDTETLFNFIIQASQYKPYIFKGWWWFGWLAVYVISTIITFGLVWRGFLKNTNKR